MNAGTTGPISGLIKHGPISGLIKHGRSLMEVAPASERGYDTRGDGVDSFITCVGGDG